MNDINKQGFAILLFAILGTLLLPLHPEAAIFPLLVGLLGLILAGWPRRA